MSKPVVGSILDGRTVVAVSPYTGKYPQWFRWFVKVTSPFTKSGWIEYAI